MKKWLILMTILFSMLTLCACVDNKVDSNNGGSNTNTTGKEDPVDENLDDTAYKDIERYQATGYTIDHYGYSADFTMINIEHPAEWSFREGQGCVEIVRGGTIVGNFVKGDASDAEKWTILTGSTGFRNGISVIKYIERKYADGEAQYRYRYVYAYVGEGGERTITLTTACAELDPTSEEKLMKVSKTKKSSVKSTGMLSDKLSNCSEILILGNSFIASSDIGGSLREILRLNGKNCNVTAISRGMATVATYINDSSLMSGIRSGEYDVVFICGLYEMAEVANLGTLKNACDASKTELVIFPAHNEREQTISEAKIKYPTLAFLDWRGELDCLIASGVNRWDLCVDDTYDHSKPLAGYVGAHMIYRAIYNTVPSGTIQYPLSQSYINSILGDYASTGHVQILDEDKIIYLD